MPEPGRVGNQVREASAPCRIGLGGPPLALWPLYLSCPGALTLSVAIDRRPWCRVETGEPGVSLESKDTLKKARAASVSELLSRHEFSVLVHILLALGIESGVKVTTQARVPPGSGLGAGSALGVAVAAAAARAVGRELPPSELARIVREAEAQSLGGLTGVQDVHAASVGGVLALHREPGPLRMERLDVDPGRVEESLILVDSGVPGLRGARHRSESDPQVRQSLASIASCAARLREALVSGRYPEVGALLAEQWEACKRLAPEVTGPEIDQIAEVATSAGGGAQVCGAGGGGVVVVWAPPGQRGEGPRDRVEKALRALGFRSFSACVDLKGLEVE